MKQDDLEDNSFIKKLKYAQEWLNGRQLQGNGIETLLFGGLQKINQGLHK